jgi:hypothetical protein
VRVLVACEFSGVVRDAFATRGHDAYSCDLLPSERSGNHLIGDVMEFIGGIFGRPWDLMIAHPPCTFLAASGARWRGEPGRIEQEMASFNFAWKLGECGFVSRICVENPIGRLSTLWRKPDQIVQPWQFGHGETKATCLWLKNLPPLVPTQIVSGRADKIHKMPGGKKQSTNRSRTYQGIARAMAEQWGSVPASGAAGKE